MDPKIKLLCAARGVGWPSRSEQRAKVKTTPSPTGGNTHPRSEHRACARCAPSFWNCQDSEVRCAHFQGEGECCAADKAMDFGGSTPKCSEFTREKTERFPRGGSTHPYKIAPRLRARSARWRRLPRVPRSATPPARAARAQARCYFIWVVTPTPRETFCLKAARACGFGAPLRVDRCKLVTLQRMAARSARANGRAAPIFFRNTRAPLLLNRLRPRFRPRVGLG